MSNFDAGRIESVYVHQGAHAAEDALRDDYLHADTPEKQKQLAAEMAQLKKDENVTHLLGHVALEFIKPMTEDDKVTRGRLSDMQTFLGNSQDDKFKKDMAEIAKSEYGSLTSLTSIRHDAHLLLPWNWGRGVMSTDVERVEHDYETQRQKSQVVVQATEMFLKNDGALFKRIAGDRGTIDKETMVAALDADKKEDPKSRHFNDEERKAVQAMVDNWDDPAVNQLKNNHWQTSDYLKTGLSSIPVVGAVPGIQHGWRNGYEWGGVLGGIGGATVGAIVGATGIGGGIIEGVHRAHAAGELTMPTMVDAAKNDHVALQVIRSDMTAQMEQARAKNANVPPESAHNAIEPPLTVQAPPEAGKTAAHETQEAKGKDASSGHSTDGSSGRSTDGSSGRSTDGSSGRSTDGSSGRSTDGSSGRTCKSSVEVQPGEGYWDVAARMLGYADDGKSLQQRRHQLNEETTPQQKAEIFRLMSELMNQSIDSSKPLKAHQVVSINPPAETKVPAKPNVPRTYSTDEQDPLMRGSVFI